MKQIKHNKTQFIVDNYVEVKGIPDLSLVTAHLNCRSLVFIVEPWPEDWYRVYAKKDAKNELKKAMSIFGGKYANTSGTESAPRGDEG